MCTMGVSVPSLHRESTDSLMNVVCVRHGVDSTLVVISTTGSNANSTRMYPQFH